MTQYNDTVNVTASAVTGTYAPTGAQINSRNVTIGDTIRLTMTAPQNVGIYYTSTTAFSSGTNCTSTQYLAGGVVNANNSGNNPKGVVDISFSSSSTGAYSIYLQCWTYVQINHEGYWYSYPTFTYGLASGTVATNEQFISGPIAFSAIQSVFGGSNPIGLSEYTEGGVNVPDNDDNDAVSDATGESGGMSLSDYRNTTTEPQTHSTGTLTSTSDTQTLPGKQGLTVYRNGYNASGYSSRYTWGALGSVVEENVWGGNGADGGGSTPGSVNSPWGKLKGVYSYQIGTAYYYYVLIEAYSGTTAPADACWNYLEVYDSSGNLDLTLTRSSRNGTNLGGTYYFGGTDTRYWYFTSNSTGHGIISGANGGKILIT